MRRAARLLAGALSVLAVLAVVGAVPLAGGPVGASAASASEATTRRLQVTITSVSPQVLKVGHAVTISGTVSNPDSTPWTLTNVYLLISSSPATTDGELATMAETPDGGAFGTGVYDEALIERLDTIAPHSSKPYRVHIPYANLPITGDPGVYRIGVRVVSSNDGARDLEHAAQVSTLVPLLPSGKATLQTTPIVTVLPITAPVSRLPDGTFANDSLAHLVADGQRLSDIVDWALDAQPHTLQILVDPALLDALTDMSKGYRVRKPGSPVSTSRPLHTIPTMAGSGRLAAVNWLALFRSVEQSQYVLALPWGTPAANALVDAGLPGPLQASLVSSTNFAALHSPVFGVAAWAPGGNLSHASLAVTAAQHPSAIVASSSSLPGLADGSGVVRIPTGGEAVPVLVTSPEIAGTTTIATTSAFQVRQRLLAEATVHSLAGDTAAALAYTLPAAWDPGPPPTAASLAPIFGAPVIRAESAVAALLQPSRTYHGPVVARERRLRPSVVDAIRSLRLEGSTLASILNPSVEARRAYQHAFAMAGSGSWLAAPIVGARLIRRQAEVDAESLSKVTLTGPPFVAMSSNSGRFPLTITNGLGRPVTVDLSIIPDDAALSVRRLDPVQVGAGQRRDVQIETDAKGSGVTSVRARLATPQHVPFGRAWTFDVRSTEIGLVIWVVMGVGGAVLFGAAAYRVVRRLRGKGPGRRQAAAG